MCIILFAGVPRVFSKTYNRIQANIRSKLFYKRWIFSLAYHSKLTNLKKGRTTPWADKLIFSQIKKVMGGKVRLIYNGSAALPYYISEFLSTVFGSVIAEGHGLTETAAAVTCSLICFYFYFFFFVFVCDGIYINQFFSFFNFYCCYY
jgi:long-chain acyl-CoA synthetase